MRKKFVDSDSNECETLCQRISRFKLPIRDSCDTAYGNNSKEIMDQLESKSKDRIHRELPKNNLTGWFFNDLPATEKNNFLYLIRIEQW